MTQRGHPVLMFTLRAIALAAFAVYTLALARGTDWLADPTMVGTDPSNYYAAGQRLRDGHPLYRLSPGDLEVPMSPPNPTTPLVSPPFIAVIWRPLAELPRDLAIRGWWTAMIVAASATLVWLTGLRSRALLAASLLLVTEFAITALSANVNAILIGILCFIWVGFRDRRSALVGTLTAFAVAVKVLPVMLVIWLVAGRRWADLRWCVSAGLLFGLVSLAGAGLANHIEWLTVARSTSGASVAPWSLPGVLARLGLAPGLVPLVIPAVLAIGTVVIVSLRARPGAGFAAAVVAMVLANPAVHDGSFVLLLPALMPLALPLTSPSGSGASAQPGWGLPTPWRRQSASAESSH